MPRRLTLTSPALAGSAVRQARERRHGHSWFKPGRCAGTRTGEIFGPRAGHHEPSVRACVRGDAVPVMPGVFGEVLDRFMRGTGTGTALARTCGTRSCPATNLVTVVIALERRGRRSAWFDGLQKAQCPAWIDGLDRMPIEAGFEHALPVRCLAPGGDGHQRDTAALRDQPN